MRLVGGGLAGGSPGMGSVAEMAPVGASSVAGSPAAAGCMDKWGLLFVENGQGAGARNRLKTEWRSAMSMRRIASEFNR
ncbi:hypothetical protein GCM10009748_11720 [Agromyces lapidis]